MHGAIHANTPCYLPTFHPAVFARMYKVCTHKLDIVGFFALFVNFNLIYLILIVIVH